MNLWTIAVLTLVVLVEKLGLFGLRTRQLNAAALAAAAVWVVAR